ncbi:MAG: twin-arginine translocase subunit TatC [Candidatus Limnocylindrales bacterium]
MIPGSTPPAPPAAAPDDGSIMSLVDHLGELRTRLFRVILGVTAGAAVGFYFSTTIRNALLDLIPDGTAQTLGPGDGFAITLRIALITGVILAMPVILYQLWAFISPGLTPAERKGIRPWIPLALLFFALGVAIAYVVLPFALAFLFSFNDARLVENVAAGPFFDFVTTTFLAFGLVMEFPILLFGLARVGILSSDRLRSARRYVVLGIAIFSAIATPGGDLVSPFVLGGTMYVLFEATVFFIRRSGR